MKNCFAARGANANVYGVEHLHIDQKPTTVSKTEKFSTIKKVGEFLHRYHLSHAFTIASRFSATSVYLQKHWLVFARAMNTRLAMEYDNNIHKQQQVYENQVSNDNLVQEQKKQYQINLSIVRKHFYKYYMEESDIHTKSTPFDWMGVFASQVSPSKEIKTKLNHVEKLLREKFNVAPVLSNIRAKLSDNMSQMGIDMVYDIHDAYQKYIKQRNSDIIEKKKSKPSRNDVKISKTKQSNDNVISKLSHFGKIAIQSLQKSGVTNEDLEDYISDGKNELQFFEKWKQLYEKYEQKYIEQQTSVDLDKGTIKNALARSFEKNNERAKQGILEEYEAKFNRWLHEHQNAKKKLIFNITSIVITDQKLAIRTHGAPYMLSYTMEEMPTPHRLISFSQYEPRIKLENLNQRPFTCKSLTNLQCALEDKETLLYHSMSQEQGDNLIVVKRVHNNNNNNNNSSEYTTRVFASRKGIMNVTRDKQTEHLIRSLDKKVDLVSFAEKHQVMAMYDQHEQVIAFYSTTNDKLGDVIAINPSVELDLIYLTELNCCDEKNWHITYMILEDETKKLILMDSLNCLRIYDLNAQRWQSTDDRDELKLDVECKHCLTTNEGGFLLVFSLSGNQDEGNEHDSKETPCTDSKEQTVPKEETEEETQKVIDIQNFDGSNHSDECKFDMDNLLMTVVLLDEFKVLKQLQLPKYLFTPNNIDQICLKSFSVKKDGSYVDMQTLVTMRLPQKKEKECEMNIQLLDVSVSSKKVDFKIQYDSRKAKKRSQTKKQAASKLDYLTFMMDKFGSKPVFYNDDPYTHAEFNTCLLIDTKSLSKDKIAQKNELKQCRLVAKQACDVVYDQCKKDFSLLKWHNTAIGFNFDANDKNYLNFNVVANNGGKMRNKLTSFDKFVKTLIVQFPIQIARTRKNQLVVMYDGEDQPEKYNIGCDTAHKWRDAISFGCYDAIISDWNGPIRVVSSMGKQSTGKSYSLNHLFGSKFDTSGDRCTDGAWMTIRVCKGTVNSQSNIQLKDDVKSGDNANNIKIQKEEVDVMYVILDFEGLGTFERSAQEDTMLAVLNASISNCTIFRCENTLGPELTRMFERFQRGVNQLHGDDSLFQGCLLMVIRDVPPSDKDGVKTEFTSKLKQFVRSNEIGRDNQKESNSFLLHMYKKTPNLVIRPYPPLGSDGFFKQLVAFKTKYLDKSSIVHNKGGKVFLQHMKLIMAMLGMNDFMTDLAGQMARTRVDVCFLFFGFVFVC